MSEEGEEQPAVAAPLSPQEGDRGEGGEDIPESGGAGAALEVFEPAPRSAVSPVTEEPAGDTRKKIDVLLKAVGDTPIMKTKKWTVERTRTIQGLIDFIKKFLKLVASEQLLPTRCCQEVHMQGMKAPDLISCLSLLVYKKQLPVDNNVTGSHSTWECIAVLHRQAFPVLLSRIALTLLVLLNL
ncbi:ubiquitin-like protein ATG12 isoform X1 [Varanus komodoensis]|uniref:ubiquitin-like protein ATG12 isoform X1 n=1 Tax=Varanus komodoensis TaxID=61221 RepID=UPI001CF7712A|nr:ubiquitin-like protein ATG12 isoform X1 [Varanus komodoensis]